MLELIGWFMISAGLSMLIIGLCVLFYTIVRRRIMVKRNHKLIAFIERLKLEADLIKDKIESGQSGREISELVFRDKEGNLNTIRIIIDHDLNDHPSEEKLKAMLLKDDGTITDTESHMYNVQEFIFSPQAVRDMRLAGIEPDELVTRMLKSSGRME